MLNSIIFIPPGWFKRESKISLTAMIKNVPKIRPIISDVVPFIKHYLYRKFRFRFFHTRTIFAVYISF